jgi:hypothetical protein
MTIVLLVAGLVSALVSGELATPIAIVVVVVFNATLNLVRARWPAGRARGPVLVVKPSAFLSAPTSAC